MTKTSSDKNIEITPENLKEIIDRIKQEGEKGGLTTNQLEEKKNWARSIVIIWGTKIGLIAFALVLVISLFIITKYIYCISKDERIFREAMELWGMVVFVSLITNTMSAFFKTLFSKVIK